jgi:carboxylate-amine ligase
VIEAHWGESPEFSVGLEEELMILDAETLELAPRSDLFVEQAQARDLPGDVKRELLAPIVEITTGICTTVEEAVAALRELRAGMTSIAREHGLEIAAAGTHPFSRPEDQEVADHPRYQEFVRWAGVSARRQAVNGLHVHVGMSSADACMHALELVLPWLPAALALSANSPYLAGEETGLMSNRAEVLAQLPRAGAPPAFRSYAEWEEFVERLVRIGVMEDYTRIWWDIRPHPQFGTLEIRVPDQPTELAVTERLASLLLRLCTGALDAPAPPHDPAGRGVYAQNRWSALRFGPRAELVHPDGERVVPVIELAHELGVEPWAWECERQLEIGRTRGLRPVCEDLIERT